MKAAIGGCVLERHIHGSSFRLYLGEWSERERVSVSFNLMFAEYTDNLAPPPSWES